MARRKKGIPMHGWLVIDKPLGPSSTQIVGKVRWLTKAQKSGHGGTLDPMATGVLTIAMGEATKTSGWQLDSDKAYEFVISWGKSTDSLDAEGTITEESNARPDSRNQVEATLPALRGEIFQMPPAYSALKVDGKRAYDLARAGEEVVLQPRNLTIYNLEILDHNQEETRLSVSCSKGTYVRSIARDIAAAVGIPGHVSELRRTKSGPFTLDHAISLEKLEEICTRGAVFEHLLAVDAALDDIPALDITTDMAERLRQGQQVPMPENGASGPVKGQGPIDTEGTYRIQSNGTLVALATIEDGLIKSKRVFVL